MTDSARILVVDNYDSFVYTIVGYLKTLGAAVTVVRNDAIDPGEADVIDEYDGVLISPGPGAHVRRVPRHAGAGRSVRRDRKPRADHHARQNQLGGAYRR